MHMADDVARPRPLRPCRREYNGEQRQRFAIAEIKPLDFVGESRKMLQHLATLA